MKSPNPRVMMDVPRLGPNIWPIRLLTKVIQCVAPGLGFKLKLWRIDSLKRRYIMLFTKLNQCETLDSGFRFVGSNFG
jgi:hypothetical protein